MHDADPPDIVPPRTATDHRFPGARVAQTDGVVDGIPTPLNMLRQEASMSASAMPGGRVPLGTEGGAKPGG